MMRYITCQTIVFLLIQMKQLVPCYMLLDLDCPCLQFYTWSSGHLRSSRQINFFVHVFIRVYCIMRNTFCVQQISKWKITMNVCIVTWGCGVTFVIVCQKLSFRRKPNISIPRLPHDTDDMSTWRHATLNSQCRNDAGLMSGVLQISDRQAHIGMLRWHHVEGHQQRLAMVSVALRCRVDVRSTKKAKNIMLMLWYWE